MSAFSDVDAAGDPDRLLSFLDFAARAEWGMKHYVAGTLMLGQAELPVLDIGCGGGHDLALLHAEGLRVVGVDPSAQMVAAVRRRIDVAVPVLRAVGEALPFADQSFGGCRIERVLMHVEQPTRVLAEAVRCLVTGGTVTVLEPDWNSLVVEGDRGPTRPGWLTNARHPGVGAELWSLLHDAGCEVIDRIEELSVWRTLGVLEAILGGVAKACAAAVAAGRVDHETASRWLEEQDRREREDAFVAYMPKILVVARRRH